MGGHGFAMMFLLASITLVHGQSISGFISIDCGKPKDYHSTTSQTNGLPYVSDFEFIDAGETHQVTSESLSFSNELYDLRSFPNGTKNCYTVKPVNQGQKYLV